MGCRQLHLNNFFSFVKTEVKQKNGFRFVGNRLSKQCSLGFQPENIFYSYNDNDQLLTETSTVNGTINYQYDANGSLISKVNQSQNESYSYTYNLQNRLASATITRIEVDQTGISKLVEITANYAYNQSGIRVRANTSTKIDNATPTVMNRKYLLDSGMTGYSQVLEEIDATNNTLVKSYTLGDDVLSQTVGGITSYLQYDGHGSTRLLTDSTSAIASRFDYDAYGKNLFSANVTNPSATDMLYSGEQFDTNLQMQYLRARYYDQSNGRFNRVDPFNGNMGDPQSLHKYAYCHGDPVNNIDPSGMVNFSLIGQLAVTAIRTIITTMLVPAIKAGAIGGLAGGLIGGGIAAFLHRLQTGTWEGAEKAFLDGAVYGAIFGAIIGAASIHPVALAIALNVTFGINLAFSIPLLLNGEVKPSVKVVIIVLLIVQARFAYKASVRGDLYLRTAHSSSKQRNVLNYVSAAEKDSQNTLLINRQSPLNDVIVHSDGKSFSIFNNGKWYKISPRTFARFVNAQGMRGKNIRLLACKSAEGAAQGVANGTRGTVVAPNEIITVNGDGSMTAGGTSAPVSFIEFKPGFDLSGLEGLLGGLSGDVEDE